MTARLGSVTGLEKVEGKVRIKIAKIKVNQGTAATPLTLCANGL